jgi:NTP pyrophosphatase (non-canonical NTP hydrolase)
MSAPTLPNAPTLADLQRYVSDMEAARGFDKDDILAKSISFIEEVGELFRALKKTYIRKQKGSTEQFDIPGEFADVLIYLCAMANRLDVDLEKAFREKEAKNAKREWVNVA